MKARFLILIIFSISLSTLRGNEVIESPKGPSPSSLPKGVVVVSDLVYRDVSSKPLQLDIYRSEADVPEALPLIAYIHGGGYRRGTRSEILDIPFFRNLLLDFVADYKVILASIDFSKGGKKSPLSALIDDCKNAVVWLIENAGKYGIDASKVGLIGNASGGHLALMAGLEDETISFIIAFGPVTDLHEIALAVADSEEKDKKKVRTQLKYGLGGTVEEVPQNYIDASPVYFIGKTSPPVLLITGEEDILFPQSQLLQDKSLETGADLRLLIVKNAGEAVYVAEDYPERSPDLSELKDIATLFILDQFNRPSRSEITDSVSGSSPIILNATCLITNCERKN